MQYVITSTLPKEFAGRTKSLLNRTKNLNEKANIPYTIISTNYNPNYNEVYDHYYKSGYISKEVKLMNVYDYLSKRTYMKDSVAHEKNEFGLMKFEMKKDEIYRYFDNGKYVLYKNYENPNNQLKFIDVMDTGNRKRKSRKEFNHNGICHKEIIYTQGTTNILEEIFYDEDGIAYLNKTYNGSKENKLIRIYYFNSNEVMHFDNEKVFFSYCLSKIIEKDSTVICDARLLDRPLIELKVPNVKKIFVFHNSHLNANDVLDVKLSYQYIIDNYDLLDYIVVLTEQQKEDLRNLIDVEKKVKVIPHSIKLNNIKDVKNNTENKLVSVGRLVEHKQIDHLIEAYQLNRDKLIDFTIEIYGTGDQKQKLEQLINHYQLQEKIMLMGSTNEPEKVFSTAKASFLVSKFEGFGLVIMESINSGCPVVAYDIKYGPRDLISPEINGLVIEQDNIQALSDAMVQVVNMDFKEVTPDNRFSDEHFIDNWSFLDPKKKSNFFSKI
ncbi:glycosyltransferase [Paenisporosarcina antarctica]|nr:glycosyltransferase [Paenisporosarcina antarctica]